MSFLRIQRLSLRVPLWARSLRRWESDDMTIAAIVLFILSVLAARFLAAKYVFGG